MQRLGGRDRQACKLQVPQHRFLFLTCNIYYYPGLKPQGWPLYLLRYACDQQTSCEDHQCKCPLPLVNTSSCVFYTYHSPILSSYTNIDSKTDGVVDSLFIAMLPCDAQCSMSMTSTPKLSRKQRATLGMKLFEVSTTWPQVTIV